MLVTLIILGALHAAPPPPADPAAAMTSARALLKKKKPDKARQALKPFLGTPDPATRAEVLELAGDVEAATKKPDPAFSLWKDALGAQDDAGVGPRHRERVMAKMEDLAKKRKKKEVLDDVAGWREADEWVAQGEKWPLLPTAEQAQAPTLPQVEAAEMLYRRAGHDRRLNRTRPVLALARGLAGQKTAMQASQQVVEQCSRQPTDTDRCLVAALRLKARARVLVARADQAAAQPLAMAMRDAYEADALDPACTAKPAPYTRSYVTASLCAALDQVLGKGKCRALEESAKLAPTFLDLSAQPPQRTLEDPAVNRAQEEYGFLLTRCLRKHVELDDMLRGTNFELTWVVQPTGLVDTITVDPRRYREHAVAGCLKDALGVFRYQPYKSEERRVVTLGLSVGN
jgi:hypothetical protein